MIEIEIANRQSNLSIDKNRMIDAARQVLQGESIDRLSRALVQDVDASLLRATNAHVVVISCESLGDSELTVEHKSSDRTCGGITVIA